MKVLVVSTFRRCPAVSALESELIAYDLILATGSDYQYGRTLYDAWAQGEPFINLEQDVVPWPGAIRELWECDHLWCTFMYPIGHSGKLQKALGVVKFSQFLIESFPDANLGWNETPWNALDAQVYGALQVDRQCHPHMHSPAVAHLSDMKEIEPKLVKVGEDVYGPIYDRVHPPTPDRRLEMWAYSDPRDHYEVLGMCIHGIDLDRQFCEQGCRV